MRSAAASLLLVVATVAVYANSLHGPFVFDDVPSIVENPSIRNLFASGDAFFPPHGRGLTVEGRPLINVSLALNYALGGTAVEGYHVLNIAVHALSVLLLFGIVRRSLMIFWSPAPDDSQAKVEAAWLGFVAALIWAVHPLQTESVTYVIQRAESIMGLCYLATLYGFIRGSKPGSSPGWLVFSVMACVVGMAAKEVMISAPLIVLIYDRTFVTRSFGEALRRRPAYYAILWASAVILICLALGTGTRGGTAGFGINVRPTTYWATQFEAVTHYLKLALCPTNLVFDYGVSWVRDPWEVVPYALFVTTLLVGVMVSLWKRHPLGFLGAFVFCILAPTSLVPGNRQTLAEHRMYLPLAAIVVLVVLTIWRALRRFKNPAAVGGVLALTLTASLGALTVERNEDYRSLLTLYRDTVAKRPQNAFARYNLGKLLAESGRAEEAIGEYRAAIRLAPDMVQAYYNLGNSLDDLKRPAEASDAYRAALAIDPHYSKAHYNLGNILLELGRKEEAMAEFSEAVRIHPEYSEARDNLGAVLLELGRFRDAEEQLRMSLRSSTGSYETYTNLGNALLMQSKWNEAEEAYRAALKINPSFTPARDRLEQLLNATRR